MPTVREEAREGVGEKENDIKRYRLCRGVGKPENNAESTVHESSWYSTAQYKSTTVV